MIFILFSLRPTIICKTSRKKTQMKTEIKHQSKSLTKRSSVVKMLCVYKIFNFIVTYMRVRVWMCERNRSIDDVRSFHCDRHHKIWYSCITVFLRILIATPNILIREIEHPLSQANSITFLELFLFQSTMPDNWSNSLWCKN